MKYVLATLCGMATTLCVFAAGVAFALAFFWAEPVSVERPGAAMALHFPTEPTRVDTAEQDYERIDGVVAAATTLQAEAAEPEVSEIGMDGVDQMQTASLTGEGDMESQGDIDQNTYALNPQHVAWCSNRYRSYRPEDNAYTPYSGGSRECISPFSDDMASVDEEATYMDASVTSTHMQMAGQQQASSGYMDAAHIESCFARYRSYRPEDNSYQPYGGGPRQQCQ